MRRRRWAALAAISLLVGGLSFVAEGKPVPPGWCRPGHPHHDPAACPPPPSSTSTSTTATTSPTTSSTASTSTTTVPPTTTSTSTSTTAPPTTTTTQPGCVGVPAGASIQAAVSANPGPVTFCIGAGVHRRQAVNPRAGQTFECAAGAVMDGENVTTYAFRSGTAPAPSNVTIRGCEIKNYAPLESFGWNEGAITSVWYEAQGGGDSWLVENVDVHHNRGAGVMLGNRGTLRASHVHHNYSVGVKLYWAPDGGLIEGNEIDSNNFDGPPDFNETGGTKFAWTTGLIVQQNHVHGNRGPGLWTDINNHGTVYRDNLTELNDGPGIVHEVSFTATIVNNTVIGNGFGAQGAPGDTWMWGAGILIANSAGAHVEANDVRGNASGVGFIHQNRVENYGSGPYAYQTSGTAFRNVVTGPGWTGAVQDIGNSSYFVGRVTFEANTYVDSTWVFGGSTLTWAQWQALGHDD